MADEVLNQEEIDALIQGVDNGEVATAPGPQPGEVRAFDLANETRIVRGRMPMLELINERFARQFRVGLFNLLRKNAEVGVTPMRGQKFSDYLQALEVPSSLNFIKLEPLRGIALLMLDSQLVFGVVDSYFGGSGRYAKIDGREFTATEGRIIQTVLRQACADLRDAWSVCTEIKTEYVSSEVNPNFATQLSPSETVLVSSFKVELEGGGGELHVTMPYSMIEPIRDRLDSGLPSEHTQRDARWTSTLREEIEEAEVELVPVLGSATLTLGRLVDLKPGDIIPCDFDGNVTLYAEGVPVVRGSYGASRGQQAVKVVQRMSRRKPVVLNSMG
jgi:flagellar motor switch protein FliM